MIYGIYTKRLVMTKDELIYELTRSFSQTSGETDVFIAVGNFIKPLTTFEVDVINGVSKIILSDEVNK